MEQMTSLDLNLAVDDIQKLLKRVIVEDDAVTPTLLKGNNAYSFKIYGMKAFELTQNTKGTFFELYVPVDIPFPSTEMANCKRMKASDVLNSNKKEEFINTIIDYCLNNLTVEHFGCCSSFIECSDAKRCLFADKVRTRGCSYRENLEAGRIFYGKNKNF